MAEHLDIIEQVCNDIPSWEDPVAMKRYLNTLGAARGMVRANPELLTYGMMGERSHFRNHRGQRRRWRRRDYCGKPRRNKM